VTGRIVTGSREPLAGVQVEAYDKDMLANDHLGSAETGADGRFRIEFRWSDYKNDFGLPEGRPDIFLKLKTPAGRKSKSKVFQDLKGTLAPDDSEEVMDLGDVVIED
jgi:hypothetical protein